MRAASLLFVVLVLVPVAAVRADGRPSLLVDHQNDELPTILEVELGAARHAQDSVVTTVVDARYAASRSVELELTLPLVWLQDEPPSSARDGVQSGNPSTAIYYVDADENGYFRLGGGLALPLSSLDDDAGLGDTSGTGLVTAMRGGQSAWLYQPSRFGVVLPVQSERRYGAAVLGGELELAVLELGETVQPVTQMGFMAAGRTGAFMSGAWLQLVWAPLIGDHDAFLSIAPFVQVDVSPRVSMPVRFLLNLDEPLGVLGDGANVWGAFTGMALRL
jgi:hypothetical protein